MIIAKAEKWINTKKAAPKNKGNQVINEKPDTREKWKEQTQYKARVCGIVLVHSIICELHVFSPFVPEWGTNPLSRGIKKKNTNGNKSQHVFIRQKKTQGTLCINLFFDT
ncbi:hypothetical protein NPIL_507581 [Nephila pilipes]|uniref:Uncharacterized protein n=1 Tax=Nephila pilipes TaxID=299642 RepID=A0A8X6TRT1_NEPPI|nr:hypothetical protein NPIL_507581 [Nephila pilipes]